jgi:pimeloyl-ACP methyl ester carboxylesterase
MGANMNSRHHEIDYSAMDIPEIINALFHPRTQLWGDEKDILISVEDDIFLGGRFHHAAKSGPSLLFFHGNGEIAADYDEMAGIYGRSGINFLPVDYRGYGRSTGTPTIAAMMSDCHVVLGFVREWLSHHGYSGAIFVMGRSLGSASALELAAAHADTIDGLIIESGLAFTLPLLRLLGTDTDSLGLTEERGFRNLEKISTFRKPCLVIHAERDHLIPCSDGERLYETCPSRTKELLTIPGADHNTIFLIGMKKYMEGITRFMERIEGLMK